MNVSVFVRNHRFLACLMLLIVAFGVRSSVSANVRLLIARPNSSEYTSSEKNRWVAALVEELLYLHLDAVERIVVLPQHEVAPHVASYRDFGVRVSKAKYIDAAKALYATHLLYVEYSMRSASSVGLDLHLSSVYEEDVSTQTTEASLSVNKEIGRQIASACGEIAGKLGLLSKEIPQKFYTLDLLGTEMKNGQSLGTILSDGTLLSGESPLKAASKCVSLAQSNGQMICALYSAARLYDAAGEHTKAAQLWRELSDKSGGSTGKFTVLEAASLRAGGDVSASTSTLEGMRGDGSGFAVLWEKVACAVASKNYKSAKVHLKSLFALQPQDPFIYVIGAKVALSQGSGNEATKHIANASKITGATGATILSSIGGLFEKESDADGARAAYEASVIEDGGNVNVWLRLGELQNKAGMDSAAALSFYKVYDLDYISYGGYLEKSRKLLESRNLIATARDVYADAFEKHREPKIAITLAGYEYKLGNNDRARELLTRLDPPWDKDPKVKELLAKTGSSQSSPPPQISLAGGESITIGAGNYQFSDPGFTARDAAGGNLNRSVKVSGTVNTRKPGRYELTYTVQDRAGGSASKKRTVTVKDMTKPVIEIRNSEFVSLGEGEEYREEGATAKDDIDGDLSDKIEISNMIDASTPGTYQVVYSVSDGAGNSSFKQKIVTVGAQDLSADSDAPQIQLIGEYLSSITMGQSWEEPSVNAIDEVDGDVTAYINIDGEVITTVPGNYTVTYSAHDKSGNKAEKSIRVTVKKPIVPDIMTADNGTGSMGDLSSSASNSGNRSPTYSGRLLNPNPPNYRKIVVGWSTFLLGAGAAAGGYLTDRYLLPKRYDEYKNADKQTVLDKRKTLEQTLLLRNVCYGAGGVLGFGFTINLFF